MTAKPPNSSTLSPDTPIETMTTVTFTDIRDSKGDLVGEGATTFDKNLTTKGTARPNTELWIRDVLTRLDDVTSSATGNWNKQLTLSTFKRYRLSAYEKLPPQDFSSTKTFVLATETPIIEKVEGKDGPIESGATYDGDSLEFSGHAPPGMEVEAFNDDASTGKTATVDPNGLFKLTLDGLTPDAYGIKIRAANGKESGVFDFRVILDVKLILASVSDSQGVIPDGGSTYDDKVTVRGYARPGEDVQLRNNEILIDGATATARLSDGLWETELEVPPGSYSLDAQALYGEGEISKPPYPFIVAQDIKLSLDDVADSAGSIPESGTTYDKKVTVSGYARPGKRVHLRNSDVQIGEAIAVADEENGSWKYELDVNPNASYSLTVEALYGDGEISAPPRTFTVALDVELSLDDVKDSKGTIAEGGTTYEDKVTVSGHARPGEEVQLLNDGTPLSGATATAGINGAWEIDIDVTPDSYSLTARALGEVTDPPRTFTVAVDVKLSLDDVKDSKGTIAEGGTTYEDKVTVSGLARPGEEVQLLNDGTPLSGATATAGINGAWEIEIDVPPGSYSLTARALGEVTDPPRTFTVALDVELSLDDVLESEDGPSVPVDGTTDKNQLIIKGHARPGESIQLLNNGTPIKDAVASADADDGAWGILLDVTDGDYSLAAQANYGDGEITAPPRTFTVASTIKPHNTRVYDSDGLIEDNGTTPYNHVIVRGDAAPSTQIKLKINGVIDPKPEPTDDAGKWVRFIQNLNYETTYQFIAVADYGDNAESNPWTITTEAAAIVPILDEVTDPDGYHVGGGGTTLHTRLTFTGQAKPLGTVEILNGNNRLGEATADETGKFKKVIPGLPETTYDIIIRALYSDNPESTQPWKFTIEQAVRATIDHIYDSITKIPKDGYTNESSVTVVVRAHRLQKVQIIDDEDILAEEQVDGLGYFYSTISGLSLKTYDLRVKPLYGSDLPHSAVHRFTVKKKLTIESVTNSNGHSVPDGGNTIFPGHLVIDGYGAVPNSQVTLVFSNNDDISRDTGPEGQWRFILNTPIPGGPYRLSVRGEDDEMSQTWTFRVTEHD